jgi:dCTP diphosphatase
LKIISASEFRIAILFLQRFFNALGVHLNDLIILRDLLRQFAADRDWDQFHSPKNLASALAVEAAELLEPFQWLTEEQSRTLTLKQAADVRKEIADVFIYLVRLADKLDVDLVAAAWEKVAENASKYPVSKSMGTSRKYTDF